MWDSRVTDKNALITEDTLPEEEKHFQVGKDQIKNFVQMYLLCIVKFEKGNNFSNIFIPGQ